MIIINISVFSESSHSKLDFDVGEFFMFGSPLALVLAYRKISADKSTNIKRPLVNQLYNLFHPTDPVAARLEPLISARFSLLPPVNVAQYQKYPLGNGQPYHLCTYYLFKIYIYFIKYVIYIYYKLLNIFSGSYSNKSTIIYGWIKHSKFVNVPLKTTVRYIDS